MTEYQLCEKTVNGWNADDDVMFVRWILNGWIRAEKANLKAKGQSIYHSFFLPLPIPAAVRSIIQPVIYPIRPVIRVIVEPSIDILS